MDTCDDVLLTGSNEPVDVPVDEVIVKLPVVSKLDNSNDDSNILTIEEIQTVVFPVAASIDGDITNCCLDVSNDGQVIGSMPYFTVSSHLLGTDGCEKSIPFVSDEPICIEEPLDSDIVYLNNSVGSEVEIKLRENGDNENSSHSESSITMATLLCQSENYSPKTIEEKTSEHVRRSSRIRSITQKQTKSPNKNLSKKQSQEQKKTSLKNSDKKLDEPSKRHQRGRCGKSKKKSSNSKSSEESEVSSCSNPSKDSSPKMVEYSETIKDNVDDSLSSTLENNTLCNNRDTRQGIVLPSFSNIQLTKSSHTSISSPSLETNSVVEKTSDEPMTTFKVKAHWRRCSELEHGEITVPITSSIVELSNDSNTMFKIPEVTLPVIDENRTIKILEEDKVPVYQSIEENIYRFEKKRCKTKKEVRRMLCDCTLSKEDIVNSVRGCDDDCLNRLLMIECGSRCATGELCSNRRFQKKKYISTQTFKTEKKGFGLRVLEDVNAGSFIIEYVGEVLSRHEFKQRVKQYAREKCNHYYFMALKSDEIIDASFMGNVSRFINHSCDPNCETQKWTVNGELRIGFFAKKDMAYGEELTFDYKFQRYGREAQKCHCESHNCTGFIGEERAKPLPLDGSFSGKNSGNKRRKAIEEKKRQSFEDLMFDEELEKLCSHDERGLRNREETLILARLMVRAEDVKSRLTLLDVILKTTEVACLRLFLDYHGLSLLWSWMADAVDSELKHKILKVLNGLPVPNKTMLLDSKVLSVVQKWSSASELPGQPKSMDIDSPIVMEKTAAPGEDKDSEDSKQEPAVSVDESPDDSPGEKGSPESSTKPPGVKSDDDSTDTADGEEKKFSVELSSLATNLLDNWSNLKEIFRIPRLEQQKRMADELEADGHCNSSSNSPSIGSETSIPSSSVDCGSLGIEGGEKILTIENIGCSRKYARKIPVCVPDDGIRPRKTLLPTPIQMTKEERRHLFAMEVQREDAIRKLNDKTGVNYDGYFYDDSASYSTPCDPNAAMPTDVSPVSQPPRTTLLPTPAYPESYPISIPPPQFPDISTRLPYPAPNMFPPEQIPFLSVPPPTLTHPPPSMLQNPPNVPIPGLSNVPVLCPSATSGIIPPTQGIAPTVPPPVALPQNIPTISVGAVGQPPYVPAAGPIPSLPPSLAYPAQNSAVPLSAPYLSNPPPYNQAPIYTSYSTASSSNGPDQYTPELYSSPSQNIVKPIIKKRKLPPNWKSATDSEGAVYYYHAITRETQWEFPEGNESADDDTPVYDEVKPKKRSTTTAAADTSFANEIAKKIKELFRTKMSSFIIQCLNAYRKPSCMKGKIVNTDDFKYLARKLTHFVMAKEVKHCKNVEELDCNENVKHKAKEFIIKYMSKFGSHYRREKSAY